MKGTFKRRITKVLTALIIIYIVGGAVLFIIQDVILFHPKALPSNYRFQFEQPFREIDASFENENLSIVKFSAVGKRKGIVLFFHGNMENVEHYKQYPSFFLRNDYDVWLIDYPGFGKTTGKRTEKRMNEQAMIMYNLATKEISSDSIVLYGKSFGTGIASFIASNQNCRQLILETPYYNIPSLAKHYIPIYPVRWMIRFSFPVNKYLKTAKCPITIFHGTKDDIVPYQHSEQLKQEYQRIELISIQNGKHNNLSTYKKFQTKLDSLLK